MKNAIVTGGSGFFGSILKGRLLNDGVRAVNIDLQKVEDEHELLTSMKDDIRDAKIVDSLFANRPVDAIFHCAAILAEGVKDVEFLWARFADAARKIGGRISYSGHPIVFGAMVMTTTF